MFFNLLFILQLVLRILHVLLQVLTQSTPNSQQIKPINLVNKPTQIKKPITTNPKKHNQTQINTIKPKIKPRSHHHWPTQSNHHHPADQTKDPPHRLVTKPTEPVTKPTDQSTNPRQQSNQTHYHHCWLKEREWKRDFTIINRLSGGRDWAPFSLNHRQPSSWIYSKSPRWRLRPRRMRERRKSDEPTTKTTKIKWTHNKNHKKNETQGARMKESETHHCKGVSLRGVAIEFVWESFREKRTGV